VPIKNGGSHSKTNLTTLCADCHSAIHNDGEAPTAAGSTGTGSRLTNYQDVFEIVGTIGELMRNNGKLHVSSNSEEIDNGKLIRWYDEVGHDVRAQIQEIKRKVDGFDPYENADSDHVEHDEFKDVVADLVELILDVCDQFLEVDRLVEKHLQELTMVECAGCGTLHDESNGFCGECGTELPTLSKCAECGEYRSATDQDFCTNCGEELTPYADARLEKIETTKSLRETQKEELAAALDELTSFSSDEVLPLWKRELQ
jgi:ribosomal protein L32